MRHYAFTALDCIKQLCDAICYWTKVIKHALLEQGQTGRERRDG